MLLVTVPMVNLTVAMDLVSLAHGHVMVMVTVPMAQMKPIVALQSAQIVNLISLIMDLNAVIPQQMHLVLTALH
jgi:hypothetical protein